MNFGKRLLLGITLGVLLTGFSFSQESFAANTTPTVDAGPDTTIDENETFLYVGSFTDPDVDTWTATVDYGDGSGVQPLSFDADKIFTLDNTYANDGAYTVLVTIDDGQSSGSDSVIVMVNNVAPSIIIDSQSVDASRTFSASGLFFDPGDDIFTATVDYDDGVGPIVLTLNPEKSFSLSHTYASEGTFTVTVTINDGTDDGIEILLIVVDDEAPVSNPGGPYTTDEGTSITLDASGSSDNGSIVSYEWDFDNDGLFDDATGVTTPVLFDNESLLGPYIVGLKVTDNDGFSSISTVGVFVNNVIPILTVIPGVTTIDEGETFTGSGNFIDPGNDPFAGSVDYGDGEDLDMTLSLNPNKTFVLDHVYVQNGIYTVIITISDNSQEGTVTEMFDVTVNNIAPTVIPGIGDTISEGDSFATSGSFSDPGEDDWMITVDYDDGSVDTIAFESDKTFEINHSFTNDGIFNVSVSVDDGDDITTESFVVTVTNVAPTVEAVSDTTIEEGSVYSSTGFITDLGDDSFTGTVDYGDGTGVLPLVINADGSFELNHVYTNNGIYPIVVEISDGLATDTDTASITVTNVIPQISITTSSVDQNRVYDASGLFVDPGDDTWSATVNYGDGGGDTLLSLNPDKTFSLNHAYSDNGAYTVVVSVDDGDDVGVLSFTASIFVNNDGPAAGQNAPVFSSTSTTGSALFETHDQDIWGPVTGGTGVVSWDLFPFQSWNPGDKGFDGFTTIADKKLGIGMDMGTNGHFGMNAKADDLKGTVDVFYDGNAALTHADINTFLAGDTTPISSIWNLNPSSTTINAGTTGDLKLDMDMKLNTFLDTEACLLGGCTDVFSIPTIDFETHPNLFTFDDSNPVNSIPEDVQVSLLPTVAVFSNIEVNPSTSSVNVVTGKVIAYDSKTFSTIGIDIDELFTLLLNTAIGCGPAIPCITLGEELQIDKTTLAWDYFDASSDIDFIANQELTFDTGVLVQLDFERPVSGVLGSLVDVTTDGSGQVTSVVYNIGDEISVTFPIDEVQPINVTPTLLLDPENTRMHNFAEVITDSDVTMIAGFADYSIQSFQVTPSFTLTYPHILGHWHCHDRIAGICYDWRSHTKTHSKEIGAVSFPGVTLPTLGPLWDSGPQGNVMKVNVLSDDDFALGGFNTVELDSFLLDPEIPPTAIVGGPYVVNEGSIITLDSSGSFDVDIPVQVLTYDWDLDNDATFESSGITVDFVDGIDGPATFPLSVKVCDYLNCDVDSGMVDVLNVAPTVDAGVDATVDEGSLYSASGSFVDPGADTWTATVDYGDGTGTSVLSLNADKSFALSHTYADNDQYTVTVTVTDDDHDTTFNGEIIDGQGIGTLVVTVNNVNPTVDAGVDQEAVIHDTVNLDPATYSDPGFDCGVCATLEDFTAIVNWGEFSDEPLIVTETPGSVGVLTTGTASGNHIYRLPGDYTVTVTVDDDDTGSTSDSLITTVLGAQDLKNRAISFLTPYESEKKIEKSIKEINKSFEPKLWLSDVYLDVKHGKKVFDHEKHAVKELQKILKDGEKKGIDPVLKQKAQDSIDLLVNADRVLAITIMLDASSATTDDTKKQNKIDKENVKSTKEFVKADGYRDEGKFDKAIDHYKKAWQHAHHAIKHDLKADEDSVMNSQEKAIEKANKAQAKADNTPTEKQEKEQAKACKDIQKEIDKLISKGIIVPAELQELLDDNCYVPPVTTP